MVGGGGDLLTRSPLLHSDDRGTEEAGEFPDSYGGEPEGGGAEARDGETFEHGGGRLAVVGVALGLRNLLSLFVEKEKTRKERNVFDSRMAWLDALTR